MFILKNTLFWEKHIKEEKLTLNRKTKNWEKKQ